MSDIIIVEEDDSDAWKAQLMLEKQKKENETLQEMTEYLDRQPVIDDEVIDNE
tara:strand:- start:66 stop:224 length:159 start_codon:yes stop_codon:yes gene_type:complete